ncbi:MAG: hypothetical protein E7576_10855 [Ruminococcaceae bacterium]|nr:hypothetical protein [Oscillospiraceae bacterium]
MSDYELLTIAKEGGNPVIRRRQADALFPERAAANAILRTAEGNPAVFRDAAAGRAIPSLKVRIDPVQDLNGYDGPWAGGSRNLIDPDALTQDGPDTVLVFRDKKYDFRSSRTYTLSVQGGLAFTELAFIDGDGETVKASLMGGGAESVLSYKPAEPFYGMVRIRGTGFTVSDAAAHVQLEVGTERTDWVPFENACPIAGRTSAAVTHNGETVAVSFPGEAGVVYGGELDLTDGSLTVNGALVTRTLAGHEAFFTALYEVVYNPETQITRFRTYSTVPENCTLFAGGIVAASAQSYNPETDPELIWDEDHDPAGHYSRGGTTNSPYLNYTWQKSRTNPGDVWYARAWMRYFDENGVSHDVHSGLYRVTVGEDMADMEPLADNWLHVDMGRDYVFDDLPVSFVKNGAQKSNIVPYRNTYQCSNFFMDGTRLYVSVPRYSMDRYQNVPFQFYGELAEPIRYSLTPRQVKAILGENVISSDCGPVTVTFVADTETVIGEGRREDRGMIAPAESGMIAGHSYAAGDFLTVGSALYRVTSAIETGGEILPGINAEETTVGEQLAALYRLIQS